MIALLSAGCGDDDPQTLIDGPGGPGRDAAVTRDGPSPRYDAPTRADAALPDGAVDADLSSADGALSDGASAEDAAADDAAVDDAAADDDAALDGAAPADAAPDGTTAEDAALDGAAPADAAPDGTTAEDAAPDGPFAEDAAIDGASVGDGGGDGTPADDGGGDGAPAGDGGGDGAPAGDGGLGDIGLRIEPWRGAEAALSLVFDDGSYDQYRDGLPLWASFGLHVTIAITCHIPEDVPWRWTDIQDAFDAGHELANHTVDHYDMTSLTLPEIQSQIDDCTDALVQNVNGLTRVDSYVHPFELTNATVEAEVAQRFVVARGGGPDYAQVYLNDPDAVRWYDLYSFAPLHDVTLAEWNAAVDQTVTEGKWLIEQCHGIGNDPDDEGVGWEPRTVAEYTAHYQHVATYGNRLWIATMGEVGRYLKSRSAAQVQLLEVTSDLVRLTVADGLSRAVYDIPLTITVAPDGWTGMTATHGGQAITVTTRADGRFQFEVPPDGATIELQPTN